MKSPSHVSQIEDRVARVAANAQTLRVVADGLRIRAFGGPDEALVLDRMAAMLAACGKVRPDSPEFALQVEREAFLREFGSFSLPENSGSAGCSVVVLAGALARTMAVVTQLLPMLADTATELLVADHGRDPRTRLLAVHIQGIRVIDGNDAVCACNLAVAATRGASVAVLNGPPGSSCLTPPPGVAWVGGACSLSLERWGVTLPTAPVSEPGLAFATSRTAWLEAGGLDPLMADGDGLEFADLALRLHRSGMKLLSCGAFETWARLPPDPDQQWQCVQRFRARWGERPCEGLSLS